MDLKEIGFKDVDWTYGPHDRIIGELFTIKK
jgi:hypothetical protein